MKRQQRHQLGGGRFPQRLGWMVPVLVSVLLGPVAAYGSGGWVDWTGGGGVNNGWSIVNNWDGGVAPVAGDYVRFGVWSTDSASVVDGDFTIAWLQYLGGGIHTTVVPAGNHLQIDGTPAQIRDAAVTWSNAGTISIGTPTSPQALNVGYNQTAGGSNVGSLTLDGVTVNAYVDNPTPGTNSGIAVGANYLGGSAEGQFILGSGSHFNAGTPAEPVDRGLTVGYNGGEAGGSGTGLMNTSDGTANIHVNELYVGNNKNGGAGALGSASGTLTMDDNTTLSATTAYIGRGANAIGVMNVNGGQFTAKDAYFGKDGGTGTMSLGGGLFAANTVRMGPGSGFNFNAGRLAVKEFYTDGNAGTLEQKGGVMAPAGLSTIYGDYQLDAGGMLEIELFDTEHDQLDVSGSVALAGGLDLKLNYEPLVGTQFVIITSNGGSGAFAGLEGLTNLLEEIYLDSTYKFRISYDWSGSNDVMLEMIEKIGGGTPVTIPAPGALMLGGIGVGVMNWLRRRRTL